MLKLYLEHQHLQIEERKSAVKGPMTAMFYLRERENANIHSRMQNHLHHFLHAALTLTVIVLVVIQNTVAEDVAGVKGTDRINVTIASRV